MRIEKCKVKIKIPKAIHMQMLKDLKRSHPFAHERVGFLFTKTVRLKENLILVIASEYLPVNDEDYIEDNSVGAKINSNAIRSAMQHILTENCGGFHVHLHGHSGMPVPSGTDKNGIPGVIDSFKNVNAEQVHGMLILSQDSFYANVRVREQKSLLLPEMISIVGYPLTFQYLSRKTNIVNKIFNRQSFLGKSSTTLFKNVRVAIVGYGGGGSHIGQQLAHIGVEKITVFDGDKIEDTNMNRLIGAWHSDLAKGAAKVAIAKRTIKKVLPSSKVQCFSDRWQQLPEILQWADVVFGCVDSYSERQQLEAECRRYLIPYIDIGMDVHKSDDEPYQISGQVILSMPGDSCMSCFGFLTEKKLALEAAKYGNIGGNPQVVWPNGILASTAVGIFVDLVTGFTNNKDKRIYLSYDGNKNTVEEHVRLSYVSDSCSHYPLSDLGQPKFTKL